MLSTSSTPAVSTKLEFTHGMDRRTSLRLVSTIVLGRAIGFSAAQTFRPLAASFQSEGANTVRSYPFPVDILCHGSRTRPEIALTFDACPRKELPEFSTESVNYLQREHVPATFFISGRWAEQCPACERQLEEAPIFELGLHG